ncbi:MAG: MATE family efflux transporter [Clostridia bacterium]
MNKNLINGSPYKGILSFSVPILLGQVLQQLYNMVDSAIVGNFVGIEALAGVGSTGALHFLVLGFVIGASSGFGVPIANCYGANDMKKLKKYFTNSVYMTAILSVFISVVMLIFIEEILTLMNTNEDMMYYAQSYMSVILAGIIGMFFYNLFSATLIAIGDSKTPLKFLTLSAVLNIVLDLVFVLVLNLGVFGTGLATVISQTVAAIACVIYINKKVDILKTTKEDWAFDLEITKHILTTSVPMGLQFSIASIGALILQSTVNTLGTAYVAAITAASKISSITMNVISSLGLTMATYSSQNLGAKKLDRINKGLVQALIMGFIYSIIVFIILALTGKYLILILISASETQIIELAYLYLLVNSGSYIICTLLHVFRNSLQGIGYSSVAMMAGVMEMIGRIMVAYVLIPKFGYNGAILSDPIAWGAALLFLIPMYIIAIKKYKNSFPNEIKSE